MKTSNAPNITRPKVIVGWLTIITQAALPLSFAYTPLVQAAVKDEQLKWYQSGSNNPSVFDDNAGTLAAAGSALSQRDSGGAAEGLARSAATGALNNSVEEWLSQFGTARVQLNLDEKFKTNGSEADLLVPLYDDKSTIFFTQLGFRHQDERNTGNLGLGARHFAGDWMLGVNSFYDNDFTGDNRRFGLGAEAWRDYLKLSANGYFRLSDWHQSRDFADYDERPANGYDLRAEGWLPAYPQLGAKLMYEQYQGDEVALFGKDNRQKDPWAFTGGVTYTPVPLFTIGAQHRAGKDGKSDSQLSLQLNYRLGESWNKQLDPDLVGASRTLAGTRYDLVERNNNIVLDYRKQETVTLKLPEKTVGKSRGTVALTFSVKSKNPLQRIDWDASALIAAGGSITQVGDNRLSITLPAYQAAGANTYRIAGVAYDTKGNSGSATADIQVEVGDVSVGSSSMTASPDTLPADGKSTSTISVKLVDADGNPVPRMAKSLSASVKEKQTVATYAVNLPAKDATVSTVEETSPGVYQAIVTAGTRAGTVTVASSFNDTALPEISITQQADSSTGRITSDAIIVATDNSVANNSAVNTVTATITDAAGNKLASVPVTFSLSGSATVAAGSSLNALTDDKGVVSVGFVNKVAESVTVTATLANGNSGSVDTHFIADSTTAAINNSGGITVDKTTVIANGSDAATFSAVVKDANGNPVPNVTVNWETDKGTLSGNSSVTDSKGTTAVTLRHTIAENAQVSARVGTSGKVNAPLINFTADSTNPSATKSTLVATPATIVADGTAISTITLTLKDPNDNAITGQAVAFSSSLAGITLGNVTDKGDGTYTASLTGITAGTATITAKVGGTALAVTGATVTLTADSNNPSPTASTLTATPATIVADGIAASTINLTLKDGNNNAISGQTVAFSSSLAGSNVGSVKDNNDGTYTAQLTGTKAGTATITTTVSGNTLGVTAATVSLKADSGNLSTANSTLTATPATIVADGKAASTITLTLNDANNNPVSGQAVAFNSSLSGVTIGTAKDNGDGTYTALLTGITAGTASITTTVGGTGLGVTAATVTLTADSNNPSTTQSTLTASPSSIVADGTAASTITLTLKDANNNAITGQTVVFNSSLGGTSVSSVTDNGDGTYTAQLTGTTAGTTTIGTTVGGNTFAVAAPAVTLTADSGNLSTGKSSLTASPATIVADGTTASTVTLNLKDANDNAVSGQTVSFNSSLSGSLIGTVQDNGDGTYTATLTGTTAGTSNITASIGGTAFAVTAASVALTADSNNPSTAKSSLTASPVSIIADGTATSTVTLSLKDAHDNAISGQTVAFNSSLSGSSVSSVTDNGDGTYTAKLTGITAGTATIAATVGGNAFGVTSASVTLTADSNNPSTTRSTLTASPVSIVADGAEASTVALMLKDANNNAISGQTVAFSSSLTGSSVSSVTDKGDGTYTAQLTGTTSGTATLTVTVGGRAFGVTAATVTLTPGAVDASGSTLTASKASINADDTVGSVITFTAKDVNGNPVTGLTTKFVTTLADTTITSVVDHNDGSYTANITGTKTGVADISVQVAGTVVSGVNANVTITSGNWDATKSPDLIKLTQPVQQCILNSGKYKRVHTIVEALPLYDTHGNSIPGKIVFTTGKAHITTVKGTKYDINGSSGNTLAVGNTSSRTGTSDSYSTESACKAEGVVKTDQTVTVTGIIDDFGTKSFTKDYKLGSGS
ncbi:TPA: invasin domain 3-containing protein [Enterobacter cloacae]